MNDAAPGANNPVYPNPSPGEPVVGAAGIHKEAESAVMTPETPMVKEYGREVDNLPKEVASAGVTIHPTTIPIPQPAASLGVTPGPANIPMPSATVTLPLTDDQIAQGLSKSILTSWRWLAEWCLRRLKQVHIGLQYVKGRLVRVSSKS